MTEKPFLMSFTTDLQLFREKKSLILDTFRGLSSRHVAKSGVRKHFLIQQVQRQDGVVVSDRAAIANTFADF